MRVLRQIIWVGDALKQLKQFPEEVKDSVGYALYKIQQGKVPRCVKPLKRLKPTVMEIVCDYDTNAYRVAYTVKIDEGVYILHCFQKKAKRNIKTPKQEIELIKQRLYMANIYKGK